MTAQCASEKRHVKHVATFDREDGCAGSVRVRRCVTVRMTSTCPLPSPTRLALNAERYPVDKARGSNRKYTEL